MGNLRRAVPGDAADLTRLRGLMYEAMGIDASARAWQEACEAALVRRLGEPDRFAAFVVEDAGRLVSGGVGWMEEHLPGPRQRDGRRGHIASMSTEPAHQRRGHARAVFTALLDWFASYDVPRVDLRATPDGKALYEAFGFRELGGATMAWTVAGVAPGMPLSPQ